MAADRLTLDVDGHTVVFTEPGKARAAARRWRRMAAELEGSNTPEVTFKQHELRARAKAAEDWARAGEERDFRTSPPADNVSAAPAGEPPPPPSPGARRQAAATLTKSGVRKGRRAAPRAG